MSKLTDWRSYHRENFRSNWGKYLKKYKCPLEISYGENVSGIEKYNDFGHKCQCTWVRNPNNFK